MGEILRTLWPYLWRYRRGLLLMIRNAIDALTQGLGPSAFLKFAALLVCLSVVKGLFQYWMRVILIGISRDIEYDLRNDLFRHLVGLSSDFYSRVRTGDIMARATNDLNNVRMTSRSWSRSTGGWPSSLCYPRPWSAWS
jgi:ATP-binding cassette subfamily B protein